MFLIGRQQSCCCMVFSCLCIENEKGRLLEQPLSKLGWCHSSIKYYIVKLIKVFNNLNFKWSFSEIHLYKKVDIVI